MLNAIQINAKIRRLLMDQLKRSPKLTVLKAARAAAKTVDLPQPVAHQLQRLIRKCESRDEADRKAVKEYLVNDLALRIDASQNEHLLLYSEAYDQETFAFDDDFTYLNESLRNYFETIMDDYPEISYKKAVELAHKANVPGATDLVGMDLQELNELFINSSIG